MNGWLYEKKFKEMSLQLKCTREIKYANISLFYYPISYVCLVIIKILF